MTDVFNPFDEAQAPPTGTIMVDGAPMAYWLPKGITPAQARLGLLTPPIIEPRTTYTLPSDRYTVEGKR